MHEPKPMPEDKNLLEEMGYEPMDVDPGAFPRGTAVFAVWLAATVGIAWLFTAWLSPTTVRPPADEALNRRAEPPPGVPRVQSNVTALQDMKDLRARESERVNGYGWSDRKSGRAYIPVELAMEKVLRDGLPTRPGARMPEDAR
jgi:hypothetical protein